MFSHKSINFKAMKRKKKKVVKATILLPSEVHH